MCVNLIQDDCVRNNLYGGGTLVCLVVFNSWYCVAHVGDCEAVLCYPSLPRLDDMDDDEGENDLHVCWLLTIFT